MNFYLITLFHPGCVSSYQFIRSVQSGDDIVISSSSHPLVPVIRFHQCVNLSVNFSQLT